MNLRVYTNVECFRGSRAILDERKKKKKKKERKNYRHFRFSASPGRMLFGLLAESVGKLGQVGGQLYPQVSESPWSNEATGKSSDVTHVRVDPFPRFCVIGSLSEISPRPAKEFLANRSFNNLGILIILPPTSLLCNLSCKKVRSIGTKKKKRERK